MLKSTPDPTRIPISLSDDHRSVNFGQLLVSPLMAPCWPDISVSQENDLIRLKKEAKLKGGFYVEPEAKLMFVIRIRG